jgi:hypothetical protein
MPKATQIKVRIIRGSNGLRTAPEISVFIACRGMVDELRRLACAFNAQQMTKRLFMGKCRAVLASLHEAAEITERFDVVLPVMDYGRFSPFFWRWFNWWDDYFKELTPRQTAHLEWLANKLKPSVEAHRPREHWLRYRHAPAFTLVIL